MHAENIYSQFVCALKIKTGAQQGSS